MPLSKGAPYLLAFLLGMLGTLSAPAATIVLSDGTLGANWTSTILMNDSWITQTTGSYSASQEATGGNPDQYRRHTGTYGTIPEGAQRSILAVNYADLIYDPSSGAGITSIGFDYDLRRFQASWLTSSGFSQRLMYVYPFLQQGGVNYVFNGSLSHFPGANWAPFSMSTTAATEWSRHPSAVNPAGPANPNFSSAGGAINFGYGFYVVLRCSINDPCAGGSFAAGLDNFRVTVTALDPPDGWGGGTPGSSEIPEPAPFILLAGGLALVAFGRRRFRNRG